MLFRDWAYRAGLLLFALETGVLALGTCMTVGCTGRPSRVVQPTLDPAGAAAMAMEDYDKNKDGVLEESEWSPGLRGAVNMPVSIDKDGDKKLTPAEIQDRIQGMVDSKLGRTTFSCRVTMNGAPFPGATVKLVPERFIGPNIQPAEGKTDGTGFAMLTVAGAGNLPGVQVGIYRVEVTSDATKVPAKYNTETILGHEISQSSGYEGEVVFAVKSR
jgi:hypothetical protein